MTDAIIYTSPVQVGAAHQWCSRICYANIAVLKYAVTVKTIPHPTLSGAPFAQGSPFKIQLVPSICCCFFYLFLS